MVSILQLLQTTPETFNLNNYIPTLNATMSCGIHCSELWLVATKNQNSNFDHSYLNVSTLICDTAGQNMVQFRGLTR